MQPDVLWLHSNVMFLYNCEIRILVYLGVPSFQSTVTRLQVQSRPLCLIQALTLMTMPTNAIAVAAALEPSRRTASQRPTLLPGEVTPSLDEWKKILLFKERCALYRDNPRQAVGISQKQEKVREASITEDGGRLFDAQIEFEQALASKNADQIKKKEQNVRNAEVTDGGKRLLRAQYALKQALANQLGPDADWSEAHQKAAQRVYGTRGPQGPEPRYILTERPSCCKLIGCTRVGCSYDKRFGL